MVILEFMKNLQDVDSKLLVGWDSADLTDARQAALMYAVRAIRKDRYEEGVPSKMRHYAGMYVLSFEPPKGDILLMMKTVVIVARTKEMIAAAKTMSGSRRPDEPLRVEQEDQRVWN